MPIETDDPKAQDLDDYFPGEPPTPEKIDQNDPGSSHISALADHTHGLIFGPFNPLPFAVGWNNFGAGYTPCQYARIGNVVVVRGLAGGPNAPSTIGTLPAGFRPAQGVETLPVIGNNALARLDFQTGGNIVLMLGQGAFVNLGFWFIAA